MAGLMGYLAAGVAGGFGKGIAQSAQQLTSAWTQQMLLEERERLEAARDENMREHQRRLQRNELTARAKEGEQERELKRETSWDERATRESLAREDRLSRERITERDIESRERVAAEDRKSREAASTLTFVQGALDRDSKEKIAHWEKEKLQFLTSATGHVLMVDDKGVSHGWLSYKDEKGEKVLFTAGKMDAVTAELAKALQQRIHDEGTALREAMRLGDPEQINATRRNIADYEERLAVLLGRSAPSTANNPLSAISDPFKPSASSTPGASQREITPVTPGVANIEPQPQPQPQPRPRGLMRVPLSTQDDVSPYLR
jgi:hypothetical protein